jgi:cytochrome P450
MVTLITPDKRWWETCKQVTDYADMQVDKALEQRSQRSQKTSGGEKEQKKERLKLVDEMAEETQDRLTLRSLVISVFSPAHDGAAVALSNAMFHIARHPSVWRKAREEILPTQHQELTYELLNSYKYVQSIFKESKSASNFLFQG